MRIYPNFCKRVNIYLLYRNYYYMKIKKNGANNNTGHKTADMTNKIYGIIIF